MPEHHIDAYCRGQGWVKSAYLELFVAQDDDEKVDERNAAEYPDGARAITCSVNAEEFKWGEDDTAMEDAVWSRSSFTHRLKQAEWLKQTFADDEN